MWILLGVLVFYLVVLAVVAFAALRPARSPIFLSPAAMGLAMEEVEFESDGIRLRGWWVPHSQVRAVAVLSHGYVMNRSENAGLAFQLHQLGIASLLYDMRGSGKSGGRQVGVGWLERKDVLAACKFAEERLPGLPRVLIGSSMGAAASAFALADDPSAADALVLDSCYHSLADATLGWWRFIGGLPASILLAPVILVAWPFAGFNPFKVNVGKALAKIRKPVLIIHGRLDNLAMPKHAERNYRAAGSDFGERVQLIWFDKAGHSEARWSDSETFIRHLRDFLTMNGVLADK